MTLQRSLLPLTALTLSAVLLTTPAHAGPTVSADLDLGTSTRSTPSDCLCTSGATPLPLYIAGFALRAGWRFDVGPAGVAPLWLLPELGWSYVVERLQSAPATTFPPDSSLLRFFVGGRIGVSVALRPELQLEPSVYGHVGGGTYDGEYIDSTGTAFDVGLSVDLRVRQHFLVGAQVGYDVVSVPSHPNIAPNGFPLPGFTPGFADPWVSYGIHAGWLFW